MKYWIANNHLILLPCIKTNDQPPASLNDGYHIIGWNWFDLKKGRWNSCGYKTKEGALFSYENMYRNVRQFEVDISNNVVSFSEGLFKI